MKSRLICILFLLYIAPNQSFAGRGGDGVRGGGQAVLDVNHEYKLLDEVTPAKCNYVGADDLIYGNRFGIKANPTLQSLFEKIDTIDWYLAFELKREMRDLFFCFTGPLYAQRDEHEITGVLPEPLIPVVQSMFRSGRYVYIDSRIESRMNDRTKTFYFLHELLHSYLDMKMGTQRRYQQLRSLTMAFAKVLDGQITTRRELYFQLEATESDLPRNTDQLDRFKTQILFALDLDYRTTGAENNDGRTTIEEIYKPSQSQINSLFSVKDPNVFFRLDLTYMINHLAPWDSKILQRYPVADIYRNALILALRLADATSFATLLNKSSIRGSSDTTAELAFTILLDLDEANQDYLLRSTHFGEQLDRGWKQFRRAGVKMGYQILGNSELCALFNVPRDSVLTDISPITLSGKAPSQVLWAAGVIVSLARSGRFDVIRDRFTQNSDFYRALGLGDARAALMAAQVPIPREKASALGHLVKLRDSLIQSLLNQVKHELTNEDFEKIESSIQWNRFDQN